MPNPWGDDAEPQATATTTNAWGDVALPATTTNAWGDAPADAAPPATPVPQSSMLVDVAKRIGRGALRGTGQVAEAAGQLGDAWADALPDWMKDPRAKQIENPLHTAATAAEAGASAIPVDAARDKNLTSAIAEGAGAAVPSLAAMAVNPVAGVLTLAGQSGEAERAHALAEGDTPEIAAEKAKLGRLGGAMLGLTPRLPVRGASGIIERLATRGAEGALVNAAQDATMQTAVDQKIDWGRVKQAGAVGLGLGLVLGVPEALALRKALGTQQSFEGKTLGDALAAVDAETGVPVTELQRQINEAVGLKSKPTEADSALRQADAEAALGERATVAASADNAAAADLAQSTSLLELRAKRQTDVAAALDASDQQLTQQVAGQALPPTASPESLAWLHEGDAGRQAEAGLTTLDSRLGAGQGAAAERARLQAQLPADSPLRAPAPAEAAAPGPEMSAQAQRMYDQYGRVNPAALLPVARAAIGGGLGYATGDTPEERVKNALLGIGFGTLASPALIRRLTAGVLNAPVTRQVADRAKAEMTSLRLRMAPQSLLPAEIRTQLRWGEHASAAVTSMGLSLSRDLEQAVHTIGNPSARLAVAPKVKDYLEGRAPLAALPPPLQVPSEKVRNYVDSLSDRAVAEGVVSGTLAQNFLSNRGSYLRRSYDIFLDPNYKPKPADVTAAIGAVQRADGISRAEAEGIVAGILDQNGRANLPDFLMGRGKVAGKDVSSLVKRQDLLPEIRTLLGEVQDPILAVNQTIPRLAHLIEHDATQRQVSSIGQRLGLFSPERSLTHPTPLVAEGSSTHDVLAGLYAPPEIAAAFQKAAGSGRTAFVPGVLWKALTTATTASKLSKTVFNPESYGPNFIGGVIANVGNGNFRYNHTGHALALGMEEMGVLRQMQPTRPGRDALRAEVSELQKLGVIGQSVNSGDLLRTINNSYFGRLSGKAKSILTIPAKVFGSTDDFNRYIAWQSERARYAKAFPQMAADELKRHAAEVVRATTPNYGEIPQVVKQLSVAGITPSFVNFTWEVFRNTKNSVKLGLRDLQAGIKTNNPALRNAGAERLAAITAVTAAGSMWGFSKLSRESNGVTDDQEKAVRYFAPPWDKSAVIAFNTPAGGGQPVQYTNLSYLVPHALLFQAIEAGKRGAEDGQMVPDFLSALNEQFGIGNNVLLPAATGAITGMDPETGRPIPKTAVNPTAGDRASYLYGKAFEPLVFQWADKWRKAVTGEKGNYGRVYSQSEQMKRLMGVRAQTLDPVQAVGWKARDLGNDLQQAADIYRLRARQELPPEELQKAYSQAEAARHSVFREMTKMLTSARALGVSDEKTIAAMRESRMGPEIILGVLDGRYVPLPKDQPKSVSDILADLQARPAQQRGAALAQLYRDDPAMGKAVIGRIKDEARGASQRDKLILGLGVSDGGRATYIRQRLEDLGNVEARRAFLLELRRKGMLTDRVLQQMTQADPAAQR